VLLVNLPLLSYLIVATGYGCVALLLISGGRPDKAVRTASLGLVATAFWAIALALDAAAITPPERATAVLDALRYAAWFSLLFTIADLKNARLLMRSSFCVCVALILLLSLLPSHLIDRGIHGSGVLLSLTGMTIVVRLRRAANSELREVMNLAALGIGGQFAFDFLFHVHAQLTGAPGAGLSAIRGLVSASMLPIVVLAMQRAAALSAALFVSRHVVFYASGALLIGAYVALATLGSNHLRTVDGEPGAAAEVVFLCVASVMLAALLLSNNVRRRLKVFIATHFYRGKYDYRVEWLRFIQTLSTVDANDAPRTAIIAVAQMFQSPGGVLYARDDLSARFEAVASWPQPKLRESVPQSMAVEDDLPRFLAERQWVVDVEEYLATPAVYGDMLLPPWLQDASQWRVVSPLLHLDRLVGFIVLRPPPPPFHMTFEDRDLFKTVGRHIALQLTQHSADHKLTESRQFDAYNRFTAFVMHDLKNAVAQLQLLVQNAARHRHNPQFFDDAISTISNSVERMTRLIGQLQTRDEHGHVREMPLVPMLEAAVARANARPPGPVLEMQDGAALLVRADPEKLGSVIDHVIRNAQEATGETGSVWVRLAHDGDMARVTVRDDGPGMDAQFVRERLFRPFDSTKGSKGMGVGAYQAREYVRQVGGTVEVLSSPGQGTSFCITLPLCQRKNQNS
jgi:putative PEP-CTERM system histidine kinase